MKVISLNDKVRLTNTCAALGIFDGVHLGHRYLLNAMRSKAKQLKAKSMVITFFPHPAHVLRPDVQLNYLVSMEHRLQLLEDLGVDVCIVIPFTKKFAQVEPESFIRNVLVKRLGVRAIFVGEDFRFGRNRAGDVELFERLANECHYDMHAMPALRQGKDAVSSTRVRALITAGKIGSAEKLLGRPFSVLGEVMHGKGRGKGLGYPTANVAYDGGGILPPNGVYAVQVIWKNKILNGVANLGTRPSFKEKNPKVHLEVYIFDFNLSLYGQIIEVNFIRNIRSERKFENPQELIRQIKKDEQNARRILLK